MSLNPDALNDTEVPKEPEAQATATGAGAVHSTQSLDWDSALAHGLVAFYQLVIAFYQTLSDDTTIREIAERYYPHLLEGYQRAYGGIKQQYYGENVVCAAVLTDKDRIDIITPAVDGKLAKALGLVADCDKLTIEINSVLEPGETRRTIMETVYGVTVSALGVIEYTPEGDEPNEERLALVQSQLTAARGLYEKAAQRQARVQYFTGVLLGLVIAVPVLALAAVLVSLGHIGGLSPVDFLGAVVAGALGAAVSVLTRLSSGSLVLDVEAGSDQLRNLGIVRPFLGAIAGLAVYCLTAGGLIPVKVPDSQLSPIYYAGLAFLAGFSERFAQDMFSLGQRQASADAKGGADAKPAAGDQPSQTGAADGPAKVEPAVKGAADNQPK